MIYLEDPDAMGIVHNRRYVILFKGPPAALDRAGLFNRCPLSGSWNSRRTGGAGSWLGAGAGQWSSSAAGVLVRDMRSLSHKNNSVSGSTRPPIP